jgi:hypothetical protein
MDIPKQQEQSAEERIGTMVGKIMVFCLGLCVYVGCKVGAILTSIRCNNSGSLAIFAAILGASPCSAF